MARASSYGIALGLTKGLIMALGAGVIITTAIVFPGAGYLYKEFKKEKWEESKKRGMLKSTIKRLEKQKLVAWKEINGELRLTLSKNGHKKILKYKIDELKLKEQKRWDGLWRVIIFDIPEKNKLGRERFRKKLNELKFFQLQKSVFVTKLECREEMSFLASSFGIPNNVHYILAREIEGLG